MWGISLAFRDYLPGMPLFPWQEGIKWTGFNNLEKMLTSEYAFRSVANTVVLSALLIVFGFFLPIIFALLINEIRHRRYKKLTQTVSYLPHFISSAIIGGILVTFLSPNEGVINQILNFFGRDSVMFMQDARYFRTIYVITHMWRTFGWGSILYLGNIASIPVELYESSMVDGANRWRQIWHITLPGIKPTIFILLILSMGSLIGGGELELVLMLKNPANAATSTTLALHIYEQGLKLGRYGSAAALSLFQAVVSFILVFSVNFINRRITGFGLW